MNEPSISEVKRFWNANPLCAASIEAEPGSEEFFAQYNVLREQNESLDFSYGLHEYPNFKGRKVLDVGCGNGYVLSKYAQEGAEVFGVDVSERSVEITGKRFELLGLEADIRVASAEELPFADDSFDCVCSMGVLHHTPNTPKAVKEVHRVLKPGGRVILMFYHRNSVLNRWNFSVLPWLHPKYLGMSRQELINAVDGFGNPKGDVYSHAELGALLADFRHLQMSAGLVQRWMFWPLGRFVPARILKLLERRWGWFIYAKGWK